MLVRIKVYFLNLAFDLANKLLGIEAPPAPSASAIVAKGKKILVIKLSYHDGFALPGGFLKGKESFEEALERELEEETGLRVVDSEYFAAYSSLSKIGNFPVANVTYLVKTKGEIEGSREGDPRWIKPKKAIKDMVYDDNKMAVKEFIKFKK